MESMNHHHYGMSNTMKQNMTKGSSTFRISPTPFDQEPTARKSPSAAEHLIVSVLDALPYDTIFPIKLHNILDRAERNPSIAAVVSWMSSSSGALDDVTTKTTSLFKVHDKELFSSTIMPRFFGTNKIKSFQRQLNMWGFERVLGNGPNNGAYQHKWFIRGQPGLCFNMQRTKIKGLFSRSSLVKKANSNVKVGDKKKMTNQRQEQHHTTPCSSARPFTASTVPLTTTKSVFQQETASTSLRPRIMDQDKETVQVFDTVVSRNCELRTSSSLIKEAHHTLSPPNGHRDTWEKSTPSASSLLSVFDNDDVLEEDNYVDREENKEVSGPIYSRSTSPGYQFDALVQAPAHTLCSDDIVSSDPFLLEDSTVTTQLDSHTLDFWYFNT